MEAKLIKQGMDSATYQVTAPDAPALERQVGGNHYKQFKIQPIKFIVANNLPYREGNALKYLTRHLYKNGKEDILKAIHYLQMIADSYDNGELVCPRLGAPVSQ